MKKPMNARLEWNACFLKCNGVCIAEWKPIMEDDYVGSIYDGRSMIFKTQHGAQRYVNKSMGLPLEFGITEEAGR